AATHQLAPSPFTSSKNRRRGSRAKSTIKGNLKPSAVINKRRSMDAIEQAPSRLEHLASPDVSGALTHSIHPSAARLSMTMVTVEQQVNADDLLRGLEPEGGNAQLPNNSAGNDAAKLATPSGGTATSKHPAVIGLLLLLAMAAAAIHNVTAIIAGNALANGRGAAGRPKWLEPPAGVDPAYVTVMAAAAAAAVAPEPAETITLAPTPDAVATAKRNVSYYEALEPSHSASEQLYWKQAFHKAMAAQSLVTSNTTCPAGAPSSNFEEWIISQTQSGRMSHLTAASAAAAAGLINSQPFNAILLATTTDGLAQGTATGGMTSYAFINGQPVTLYDIMVVPTKAPPASFQHSRPPAAERKSPQHCQTFADRHASRWLSSSPPAVTLRSAPLPSSTTPTRTSRCGVPTSSAQPHLNHWHMLDYANSKGVGGTHSPHNNHGIIWPGYACVNGMGADNIGGYMQPVPHELLTPPATQSLCMSGIAAYLRAAAAVDSSARLQSIFRPGAATQQGGPARGLTPTSTSQRM
ncbi:hypothetical protein JKP88DRAFT_256136, partial [Tribonema minus]